VVSELSAEALIDALGAHERERARLALAVRHVEQSGEWAADGAVSVTAWLRDRARLSHPAARRWVRLGRFLDRYPALADAALAGTLSAGQIDTVQAACPSILEPVLDDHQTMLVTALAPLSVADTHTACQLWQRRAEAVVDEPPLTPEAARELTVAHGNDGTLHGRFVLTGDAGLQLDTALATASRWDGTGDTRTAGERRADALGEIAAFFNANHTRPGTPRHRPHIELCVDADTLAGHPTGVDHNQQLIDPATTAQLLCDCKLHTVIRDHHGLPISYGRARYTVPRHLFRLVALRDRGCRYPGCDRPVRWCDAHHLHHWEHGGPTDHDNLALLCNRHHHHVHRQHLDLKLTPTAELHVTWPDGRHHTSQPHGPPP
jgi:Domain of unknown function (DUF222)